MKIIPSSIPDVLIIEPEIFQDERGFFMETYQARRFAEAGMSLPFVQDNHSGSRRGTLRGLHYQIQRPQGKLVWAVAGAMFDVAVDLRRQSPTFGEWVGIYPMGHGSRPSKRVQAMMNGYKKIIRKEERRHERYHPGRR